MNTQPKQVINEIFQGLHRHYGFQNWWPGETPFEVMVGAILTQNTSWSNVEKAIINLKQAKVLDLEKLLRLEAASLAELIRPAGYFNVKTKRLKAFLAFLQSCYQGDLNQMRNQPTEQLRHELLSVKGIGKETADSILLYALEHPIFVIDTYTYRVLSRHYLIAEETNYDEMQELMTDHISIQDQEKVAHYNEFHALLVSVGKEFCKPKPKCENCPLNGVNW